MSRGVILAGFCGLATLGLGIASAALFGKGDLLTATGMALGVGGWAVAGVLSAQLRAVSG